MPAPLVEIPYFESACHKALDSYLVVYNFKALMRNGGNIRRRTSVVYSNGDIITDFNYWPEDFPNYCLNVGLGFVQGDRVLADSVIGLWYAIPPDNRETWQFRNERELDDVLSHVCDDVLPIYAAPLWKDPHLLRQLINRFRSEQSAKTESEKVEKERLRAEIAFKAGNYKDVVSIYSQLSPVDLNSTDRKRLGIARKRLQ